MSNQQPANTNDQLRLGIEAARTGKENEARAYLIAVLKQDPNNIPAMLWLAFVLPSPQDTIRLLKRVLALDPQNERAKAGIRWARVRLGLPPEGDSADSQTQPESAQIEPDSAQDSTDDTIRALLLSEEVQQQAKKGALAHRARRTINPFLGIFLLTGALGLIAIGLGALVFVPPDTLAAWMPAAPRYTPVEPGSPVAPVANPAKAAENLPEVAVASPAPAKTLTSAADTIVMPEPPHIYQLPAESETDFAAAEAKPAVADLAHSALAEAEKISINPSQLIGPVGLFPSANPAVDPASLAHQPAYPGEKWIEVNVTTQQVTAWEGNVPVMSFTVSTGLPNTPTVLGKFNIYWKLKSALMIGPNYYLPEVPYTMYFYAGYALHGTYWHNNFGQPMSHGCVNLETGNAQKLFDWAGPFIPAGQTEVVASANNSGTLVVVHE
jgi:lipoprotein-anchoring transpeptidase ErfK/SrfK